MPAVYRILHMPTGLYFCPSREVKVKLDDDPVYKNGRYVKSNLSKTGKAYLKRPSISYVGERYYTHLITSYKQLDHYMSGCTVVTNPAEWQIVEVV